MLSSMPGRFIVLEGPDGSGTTHHSKRLAETLRTEGLDVLLTAEPSAGPVGARIREFLREGSLSADALQLLFCADRADHVRREIMPALEAGKIVISDRYALSTVAYGEALGLDPEWLLVLNNKFIQPHLHLLLLPPLSVALERVSRRKETDSMERQELQERVHAAYARLADGDPAINVIDTDGEKDVAAGRILELVRAAL
jgi:dTMP kinase